MERSSPLAKKSASSKAEKGADKFVKSTTTEKIRPRAANSHRVDCTLEGNKQNYQAAGRIVGQA
jgi:hypothetical protein